LPGARHLSPSTEQRMSSKYTSIRAEMQNGRFVAFHVQLDSTAVVGS